MASRIFGMHLIRLDSSTSCSWLSTRVGHFWSKKYGILDLRQMVSETCKAWYGLCRIFVLLLYVHQHSNIFEHFQISTIVIPTHVKMEQPALMEWIRILAVALLVILGSTARRVRRRRKQLYFADYSRHFGNGMRFPLPHWVVNGLGNVWWISGHCNKISDDEIRSTWWNVEDVSLRSFVLNLIIRKIIISKSLTPSGSSHKTSFTLNHSWTFFHALYICQSYIVILW